MYDSPNLHTERKGQRKQQIYAYQRFFRQVYKSNKPITKSVEKRGYSVIQQTITKKKPPHALE